MSSRRVHYYVYNTVLVILPYPDVLYMVVVLGWVPLLLVPLCFGLLVYARLKFNAGLVSLPDIVIFRELVRHVTGTPVIGSPVHRRIQSW